MPGIALTMSPVIVTRSARVWLGDDGVVHLRPLANREQDLEDAMENVAAVGRACAGEPKPLIVHFEEAAPQTAECRAYYTSEAATRAVSAVAIVTNSMLGRIIGNLMIGMSAHGAPIRLFDGDKQALAWLRAHLPETAVNDAAPL